MMRRRRLCAALALTVTACAFARAAAAQVASRIRRVGVLFVVPSASERTEWLAFVEEMSRRGWVEGRTVTYEKRLIETFRVEGLEQVAAELCAADVQAIFVGPGSAAALAVKKATKTIPVVFHSSADPVGLGLVQTLGHPGGNLTGSSNLGVDIDPKAIQFLAEAVGRLSGLAFIQVTDYLAQPLFAKRAAVIAATARTLGAKLDIFAVNSDAELIPILKRLQQQGFNAAMCERTSQFTLGAERVAALFSEHRLATIGDARAGFLLYYEVLPGSLGEAAAGYVDRILRGANPADLPVQQAPRHELVINMRTARALGLSLPRSLLQRADELIDA